MKAITEQTCESAWLEAASHLEAAPDQTEYNLVVEILRPMMHSKADHLIRKHVDDFLRKHEANPLTTVAGTIFPSAEYKQFGRRGVYEVYPEETFPEIRSSSEWGRYAHRLVRWKTVHDSKPINPLKTVVSKIKSQLTNGKRLRACYELSLTDSAIDLPLYDPATDRRRTRGGPCLSHLSLKLGPSNTLNLTALYRSHSFVERALGNYLGLAALQAFVCEEAGLAPGTLMCVSTYARIDTDAGWSLTAARGLVRSIKSIAR